MRIENFYYYLNKITGEVIHSDEKPSSDWKRIKRSEYYHRVERRPTKRVPDAVDSAASQALPPQSGESSPEVDPAATQRR